jgi:uncharacterized protein YbjT (DUF2867 family)
MNNILVTGVTGLIGGEISKQLQNSGIPHRALVRKKSNFRTQDDLVDVIEGSFEDAKSLEKAMDGVSRAFLASFDRPEVVNLQKNFITAARNCGVEHIVRMSTIGIDVSLHLPVFKWHGECEAQLEESGITYTHLQPAYVMQNFLGLVADDFIRLPAGNGQSGFVDARDIAAVGVAALTTSGHENKSYVMSSEVLTHQDIASILSGTLGRMITFEDISLEIYREKITNSGWAESSIDTMLGLYSDIRTGKGFDDSVTQTVENVLGRRSLKFFDFARDYAALF